MLEEEIVKLKSAVIELTAVILNLADEGKKAKPKAAEPKTKAAEPKAEPKAEPQTPLNDVRKALQDLCLTLVRKDPVNKEKVKKIIQKHGGDLIKDVPDEKLFDLQVSLEAL